MTSILTGLDPRRHGVHGRNDALAPGVDTLAERLAAAGYRTTAVITNGNLAARFGLDQGFEEYIYLREIEERPEFHVLADGVNEAAFSRLKTLAADERPFFLYLHTSDPHAPYWPREPYRRRFAGDVDPARGRIEEVLAISRSQVIPPPGTAEDFIDLYDAEIAFNDEHFGRLIDRLRTLGIYDDTVVVVVSDHGEEFFDHGGWEHGKTLFAEQLRVPLIVKLPHGRGAGRRIGKVARQLDIVPTVLELAGLSGSEDLDGASLMRLIESSESSADERASFAHLQLDERRMSSVVARGWKLIADDSEWVRAARKQLFHVEIDASEREDRYFMRPIVRGYLYQLERGWRVEQSTRRALPPAEKTEVDAELAERLQALGYLD